MDWKEELKQKLKEAKKAIDNIPADVLSEASEIHELNLLMNDGIDQLIQEVEDVIDIAEEMENQEEDEK